MRYIEKVALAWAENGISSVKQAKTCIDNHNETTYAVLNAFGIKNRTAGKYEQDFIKNGRTSIVFLQTLLLRRAIEHYARHMSQVFHTLTLFLQNGIMQILKHKMI